MMIVKGLQSIYNQAISHRHILIIIFKVTTIIGFKERSNFKTLVLSC